MNTTDNSYSYLRIEGNILKKCVNNAVGEIIIPDGIEEIESQAFQDCCYVTRIIMPNSVRKLGFSGVFNRCTSLELIKLSLSLESLSYDCFSDCINLTQVSISQGIKVIESGAFRGCCNLQRIELPESLQSINSEAFKDCSSLESISIPRNVKYIYNSAFYGCKNLTELEIPESVDAIYDYAFSQCTSLTKVKIQSKSIHISPSAFIGCKMINRLYLANFKPLIALSSFAGCPNLNFISPIDTESISSLTTSTEVLSRELSTELKYMSLFYRQYGMNITQTKWANNQDVNSFKSPYDSNWEEYKTKEQDLNYILNLEWSDAHGIGLILGYNEYRALDVDGVNLFSLECSYGETGFDTFINQFLDILGLPNDYPWVIYSGSGEGFHIIFKTKDLDESIDSLSFEPNDHYDNGYGDSLFHRIELRWSDHLVLPPSLHSSSNQYSFRNKTLPTEKPKEVSITQIDNLLNKYTAELSLSKYNYNNMQIELVEKRKIYSRHNSRLTSHEHTEDTISWLKNSKTDESINSLALRYLLGNLSQYESSDAKRAKELFLQSNSQSALFNLVSLYACGLYACDFSEFKSLYDKLDHHIFEKQLELINLNASKTIKFPNTYMFFDTETTGVPDDYNAPASKIDNWPRLLQLSWIIATENGETLSTKDYIIKPNGFSIPAESISIHGITNEFAQENGIQLCEVLDDFILDLSKVSLIVGHNVSFDKKIVGAELIRLGREDIISKFNSFCTMKSTKNLCRIPGRYGIDYKYPKLQELYYALFKKQFDGAHNSLSDIKATVECFFELKRRALISLPGITEKNEKSFNGNKPSILE